jgi:hypothetical protein
MNDDPTKPEFFALWSLRDLQLECARLNRVLQEAADSIDKSIEELKEAGGK